MIDNEHVRAAWSDVHYFNGCVVYGNDTKQLLESLLVVSRATVRAER